MQISSLSINKLAVLSEILESISVQWDKLINWYNLLQSLKMNAVPAYLIFLRRKNRTLSSLDLCPITWGGGHAVMFMITRKPFRGRRREPDRSSKFGNFKAGLWVFFSGWWNGDVTRAELTSALEGTATSMNVKHFHKTLGRVRNRKRSWGLRRRGPSPRGNYWDLTRKPRQSVKGRQNPTTGSCLHFPKDTNLTFSNFAVNDIIMNALFTSHSSPKRHKLFSTNALAPYQYIRH